MSGAEESYSRLEDETSAVEPATRSVGSDAADPASGGERTGLLPPVAADGAGSGRPSAEDRTETSGELGPDGEEVGPHGATPPSGAGPGDEVGEQGSAGGSGEDEAPGSEPPGGETALEEALVGRDLQHGTPRDEGRGSGRSGEGAAGHQDTRGDADSGDGRDADGRDGHGGDGGGRDGGGGDSGAGDGGSRDGDRRDGDGRDGDGRDGDGRDGDGRDGDGRDGADGDAQDGDARDGRGGSRDPRSGDGGAGTAGGGRPRVLAWSRSPAAVLVGVLIGLLGFGLAVQVRSNTSTSGLPAARQEDLVRILDDLSSREDRLRRQIADLEAARSRLSTTGDTTSTALEEARKRSDALGILAGTVAAQGPGVVLTLTDPERRLAAEDLLDTVEELRAAGAEAIQVGGVRIGLDSSFTAADGGVAVDGVAVTAPYTILAIGDPPTLATAMGIPGGVADTARRAGGEARTEQRQQVVIRELRPVRTPRYSQPTD